MNRKNILTFNPLKKYEKRILFDGSNNIVGYCVFRCAKIINIKTGIILDIFAKNKEGMDILINDVLGYFIKNKMKFVNCFMIKHNFYYNCMKKRGFFIISKFLLPKKNVLVIFNPDKQHKILNIKKWYLSYGDWDRF